MPVKNYYGQMLSFSTLLIILETKTSKKKACLCGGAPDQVSTRPGGFHSTEMERHIHLSLNDENVGKILK